MRWQTTKFVEEFLKTHGDFKKVLDVGSGDVNGSVKPLFSGKEYVGIDMRPGPGVDIVLNAHDIKKHFKKESFDLVVCFDTFEHDDAFWLSIENMKWVLKKGGWMILGAPSRRCPEHDHPHDYWRFMPQSMGLFFEGFSDVHTQVDREAGPEVEDEVYGWGRK